MAKKRYQFSDEQKRSAVDEYVSGRRRAEDVAKDLGVPQGYLYKWRIQLSDKAKGVRVEELEDQGFSRDQARIIEQQREELEAYKATVAQQAVIIDLLKKLRTSTASQRESEVTGLIETTKRLGRVKRPANS